MNDNRWPVTGSSDNQEMTHLNPQVFPQITPEYWRKVKRTTAKVKIAKINNKDGFKEIILANGLAFMRKQSDIGALLLPNTEVIIEMVAQGEIITGMFVPPNLWAFRMTAEDLADYTRRLLIAKLEHQRQTRKRMVEHLSKTFEEAWRDGSVPSASEAAEIAMAALEAGPR